MNGWRICWAISSTTASSRRGRLDLAQRQQRRDPPLHRLGLDVDVADLLGELAGLGQHREDLREASACSGPSRRASGPSRGRAGRRCRRAIAIASSRTTLRLRGLALELERAGESGEERDPQRGSRPRRARRTPPRGASRAPCSCIAGRQHASSKPIAARVSSSPSPSSRAISAASRNDCSESSDAPARNSAVPSVDQDLGAPPLVCDPDPERDPQVRGGLLVGERRRGGVRGEQVVLDRALRAADRRRRGEVVGEVGERARVGRRGERLDRLADAQVQLGAPEPAQPVVQGAPHELVREAVREPRRRHLLDHPAPHRRLERVEPRRAPPARRGAAGRARTRCRRRRPARAGRGRSRRGATAAGSRPRARSPASRSPRSGRVRRRPPSVTTIASVSTSVRQSSLSRNALPSVSARIAWASSARAGSPRRPRSAGRTRRRRRR